MAVFDRSKPWIALAVVVAATAGLAACGVKGPLEPPAAAASGAEAKSAEAQAPGQNSAAPQKPHEPFVLDGLLR
jgi:predicted small lipoprotein YifL